VRSTARSRGRVKGQPFRFAFGHRGSTPSGPDSAAWRGGRRQQGPGGYISIYMPEHARADQCGYVREHVLVAEKAMGRALGIEHPVHHVDGNPQNNANDNLVVCEDNAYHMLIERRTRAWRACGNPNARKCSVCKQYDVVENLVVLRRHVYHRECNKANHRRKRGI
jgi:hypothetical protein